LVLSFCKKFKSYLFFTLFKEKKIRNLFQGLIAKIQIYQKNRYFTDVIQERSQEIPITTVFVLLLGLTFLKAENGLRPGCLI
jgi:hypothetical protein